MAAHKVTADGSIYLNCKKKARYESGLEVHIKGGDMEETGVTILIWITSVCFPLEMPDIQ
jgi:hypothetical protein